MYTDHVTITTQRVRNPGEIRWERRNNITRWGNLREQLEDSPLNQTAMSISGYSAGLIEVDADVSFVAVATNLTVATDVAASLFEILLNTTQLYENVASSWALQTGIFEVLALRAEFYDLEEDRLVVIEGSLPPPPPAPPPSPMFPVVAYDPMALSAAEEAVVTTVTAVVTVAVTSAVTAAVASAVATSVASATASATATAAAGSAGASAGGGAAGSGAGSGAGSSAGSALPLVFGVQRFNAAANAPANQSALQSGVAGSMGTFSGELVSVSGDGDAAAGGRRRRRLQASPLATKVHALSLWLSNWMYETRQDPQRRLNELVAFGRRLQDGDAEGDQEGTGGGAGGFGGVSGIGLETGSGEFNETQVADEIVSTPEALTILINKFASFCLGVSIIALVQVFCIWYWRYRMNRQFYAELYLPPPPAKATAEEKEMEEREEEMPKRGRLMCFICGPRMKPKKKKPKKASFVPFPATFVFPSLLTLGISFFATGLVGSAIELIMECTMKEQFGGNRSGCAAPGVLVVVAFGVFLGVNFSMLVHFNKQFRSRSWEPLVLPDHPNDVEDPLFRLVSRIRYALCWKCRDSQKVMMDRARGEYMRPWDQVEEPARTERLLANPYAIYKDNTADAIDSLKMLFMSRSSGFSFAGVTYDFFCTMVQWIMAALNGLGPHLTPGSSGAFAQLYTVITVQYGAALYIMLMQPSVDRVDALGSSLQFAIEGTMTLTFILGSLDGYSDDDKAGFQDMAFYLALLAMMLPMIFKVYDLVRIGPIDRPLRTCTRTRLFGALMLTM